MAFYPVLESDSNKIAQLAYSNGCETVPKDSYMVHIFGDCNLDSCNTYWVVNECCEHASWVMAQLFLCAGHTAYPCEVACAIKDADNCQQGHLCERLYVGDDLFSAVPVEHDSNSTIERKYIFNC